MNPTLSSFVETLLTDWYSTAARWSAPGNSSPVGCPQCEVSSFLRLPGLVEWPHDVIHPLVASLEGAVLEVQRSLEELDAELAGSVEPDPERRAAYARHALKLVYATAMLNSEDILDVLENCVGPAIEEYVARELRAGMLDFEQTADSRDQV